MKRSEFLERIGECRNVTKVLERDFWKHSGIYARLESESESQIGLGDYFYLIDYATFGDYDNSTMVERSNFAMLAQYCPYIKYRYNGMAIMIPHNLRGIKSSKLDIICDMVEGLDSYPIIDDDHFSRMEYEAFEEYWENDRLWDFSNILRKLSPISCFDEDYLDGLVTRDIFSVIAHNAFLQGISDGLFVIGAGGVPYIDLKRLDFDPYIEPIISDYMTYYKSGYKVWQRY